MPLGNLIYMLLGVGLASALVAVGIALGYMRGRASATRRSLNQEIDHQGVLTMLRELGATTSEYSGSVSEYQSRIGELSDLAKRSASGKADGQVISLLSEIMQNNSLLQTRLDAAEVKLENQTRQIESYLTEARTDSLTRLSNRRAFDAKLEDLFMAYRRGGRQFVIALLDIDHFKKINDTFGHPVGDEVLRQFAILLRQSFENALLIARYGGEEFVLLLPTSLRQACDQVDRMRRRLASEPIRLADRVIPITMSAGLSEPREETVSAVTVRRADESLYAAKHIGRNRVYFHDGRQPVLLGAPEVINQF